MAKILLGISLLVFLCSCRIGMPDEVADEYSSLPDKLDFNLHVKPILSDRCFLCHGPDEAKRQGDLRLDMAESAYAELPNNEGKYAIDPGHLRSSEVYHRILSDDPEYIMPSPESNLILAPREKAILIKWIKDGAEYKPHWAFIKPELRDPPKVDNEIWVRNSIDQFVAQRLEKENLQPSAIAAKEVLLRRVTFDLTGLPPTEYEIQSFLSDSASDAYEKVVDRLMASPHYGEKMAIDWMDLSRYSDTHGYTVDFYRDVSPWRDWVIDAFNKNMSYDTFIEWQLAGDLLPGATSEQIVATTFNRLHPQNLEDGIVGEEFRVEYVADRTATLGQGFMALTLGCARCHDHKYDPVSQKNFYELYSFFNNVNEAGLIPRESSTPVPTLLLPDEKEEQIIAFLEDMVHEKTIDLEAIRTIEQSKANQWLEGGGNKSMDRAISTRGLVASYSLNGHLRNDIDPRKEGKMDLEYAQNEVPNFTEGYHHQGLLLNGDAWLDLDPVGIYQRKDPFSIGLWIYLPTALEEGVIFHKGKGTQLHAYRGYHLYLRENRLEIMLSHTWPDNAILKQTVDDVPKDQWIHLMLTYDGSSKAAGINLYVNGKVVEMESVIDNLYKDIIFFNYEDVIYPKPIEPGLQIGGRWRGVGVKNARVDNITVYDVELTPLEVLNLGDASAFNAIVNSSASDFDEDIKADLQAYYLANYSKEFTSARRELQRSRAMLFDTVEQVQEIMVMKEMENPRQAYVLERGIYDNYGEEVFPNVPEKIMPWKKDLPKNRLGLAKWLVDPEHPLTARVAVNRYWQNYFGRGLVSTTEDFGNQGALPSHPELLDWLALEFINSGWDVKALQKLIVMSATYQQSSAASEELLDRDADNILLARGPKMRLTSEMMRDNALLASGLLNPKIGGESVKPYQPEGLWQMNSNTYVQDSGDNLYRRSLYTLWKRTVPNPTLATFDQPERSECTVRRQKTNTPLQALVLLNDPTYIEAAKVIGESITREGGSRASISQAYRKLTGRIVSSAELDRLMLLQEEEYKVLVSDQSKASGWLEIGAYQIDQALDQNLVAANAIVASVILNSDASITKR